MRPVAVSMAIVPLDMPTPGVPVAASMPQPGSGDDTGEEEDDLGHIPEASGKFTVGDCSDSRSNCAGAALFLPKKAAMDVLPGGVPTLVSHIDRG